MRATRGERTMGIWDKLRGELVDVVEWIDSDPGETAVCPHCGIDAVVGFNGPIDVAWVAAARRREFE